MELHRPKYAEGAANAVNRLGAISPGDLALMIAYHAHR